MFQFITKRPLWLNMLVGIILAAALGLAFLSSLNFFTKHGETLRIPSVTGKSYADAKKLLESKGFDVAIQDSIYNDSIPPLSVTKQFPDADEVVKVNRTVYLTVNRSVPPTVGVPNLVGMSFRQAELVIAQFGFKLGDTSFRPDFAKNAVLKQIVDGREVNAGEKIAMGSKISLILGRGLSSFNINVPNLVGMTYMDAKTLLDSLGINMGAQVPDGDVKDVYSSYIYKQNPEKFTPSIPNRIKAGQSIDIWLSSGKPVTDIDSTSKDTDQ